MLKNHNLGLEVPYRYGSETRRYLPDFIVLVDDGHGSDDPLHLVVEIKGYRREDAKEKKATMETYWVPAVNNLGTLGRWAFAELTEIYQIESDFEARVARVRRDDHPGRRGADQHFPLTTSCGCTDQRRRGRPMRRQRSSRAQQCAARRVGSENHRRPPDRGVWALPGALENPGVESPQQKGARHGNLAPHLVATPDRVAELDRLGDAIAELSAHLDAATARLLDLIREFDAQGGWNTGFRSCAEWLSWRDRPRPGRPGKRSAWRARSAEPATTGAGARPRRAVLREGQGPHPRGHSGDRGAAAGHRPGRHRGQHVEQIVRGWRRMDRKAEIREAGASTSVAPCTCIRMRTAR